jgi:predicted phosphoribosyltransferase
VGEDLKITMPDDRNIWSRTADRTPISSPVDGSAGYGRTHVGVGYDKPMTASGPTPADPGEVGRRSYVDRADAGDVLAGHLGRYAGRGDVVVLGLVRGGVPVAARVAGALGVPLDVLVVRKLGVPWAREVAFGALGPADVTVHNREVESHLSPAEIAAVVATEKAELRRREELYRAGRPPLRFDGAVAIIVDDGLATGATARAAVGAARRLGAASAVLAVPVGARDSVELLRGEADEVICPLIPEPFGAVSRWYDAFGQTTDDEVIALLR